MRARWYDLDVKCSNASEVAWLCEGDSRFESLGASKTTISNVKVLIVSNN